MKVLIDTNFFMIPFKFKIDIFAEFKRISDENPELYTLSGVIDELKKIAPLKTQFFKELIEKNSVKILKSEGKVDDYIVKISKNYATATNDRALRKRLKEKNAKIILMREKSKLEFA